MVRANTVAIKIRKIIRNSNEFNVKHFREWDLFSQIPKKKLPGKLIFIEDENHPETKEKEKLKEILTPLASDNGLRFLTVNNTGKESPWFISIITCPEL